MARVRDARQGGNSGTRQRRAPGGQFRHTSETRASWMLDTRCSMLDKQTQTLIPNPHNQYPGSRIQHHLFITFHFEVKQRIQLRRKLRVMVLGSHIIHSLQDAQGSLAFLVERVLIF
jgi:hypothetical protein